MFKLLALRVLDGCAESVQKCLREYTYYYFCTDYRFEESNKVYRGSRYVDTLHESFFTPIPEQHYGELATYPITINVNAIVGKNGDGKSTIIEIIMRLVNNYVAKLQTEGKYKSNQKLIYIDKVYAELYFIKGATIYKLLEEKSGLHGIFKVVDLSEFDSLSKDQSVAIQYDEQDKPEVLESIYTLVSNYSHYAYNTYDFKTEWKYKKKPLTELQENEACWLYHIFHKNDGYIIPIALHPHRESGLININKEAELAKQRLLHLFVQHNGKSSGFRKILGKEAVGIRMSKQAKSKYLEHTIKDYFQANKKEDDSLDWAIGRIEKQLADIKKDLEKNVEPFENFGRTAFILSQIIPDVDDVFARLFEGKTFGAKSSEYREFIKKITSQIGKGYVVKSSEKSSISRYVNAVEKFMETITDTVYPTEDIQKASFAFPNIEKLQQYKNDFGEYNLSQIARLYTIYTVALRSEMVDTDVLLQSIKGISNKSQAQLYIIYKTLSIFEKYPQYQQLVQPRAKKTGVDYCMEYADSEMDALFNLLNKEVKQKSHVVRKLIITQNYLKQKTDLYEFRDSFVTLRDKKMLVKSLSILEEYYGKVDIFHSIPPIFDYSIMFRDEDADDFIPMESLSSGEKQLLNTIGALIYHLRNIDSTHPIKYDTVNLLLEEIELYFHPEYQRLFVNLLLEQIHRAGFYNIRNMNITFVTHSPFVLSDIPKSNVLFLESGNPNYKMQENTFGANIHSLFKNGFFLPNWPIGEFAYRKINELFRQLNSGDYDHSEENMKRMRQEIALVGEPYLREQLYRLLPK